MPDLVDFKSHCVDISLNILLKDRTTEKNIIFATDAYDSIEFTTSGLSWYQCFSIKS